MVKKISISILIFAILLLLSNIVFAENTLTINTSLDGPEISSDLYGIFFEDINHAVDGGLYAELVYNRAFEHTDQWESWTVEKESDQITRKFSKKNPLNKENPNYLHIDFNGSKENFELYNSGHGGIAVEKDKKYNLDIYLNTAEYNNSQIDISLVDKEDKVLASDSLKLTKKSDWQKYELQLISAKTEPQAELKISAAGDGNLDIGFVSLFPEATWKNRENGLRPDLMQLLVDLDPDFMRFPGGCLVGGDSLENAYRWKETIGDVTERPTKRNLWGYHQSMGIGYYEYFLMAEDMSAEPIPIINAGMTDIAFSRPDIEYVPMEDLDNWINSALDLIEFANGDTDTKWGAVRAEHGHPEPFNLKYLGVGNENWGEEYFERFKRFEQAIKAVYPDIQVILSGGTQPDDVVLDRAWEFGDELNVDIVEEHMYRPPQWFINNVNRHHNYRSEQFPEAFIGEYAAHPENGSNNLAAALSEAAFLTGIEKNSDKVIMASYAPLLKKIDHSQWEPDLIHFTNTETLKTPSYHVQKLFSRYQGDRLLDSNLKLTDNNIDKSQLFRGKFGLGSWATKVAFDDLKVYSDEEILLKENFDSIPESAEVFEGDWSIEDGTLVQSTLDADQRIYFDEIQKENYTIELKAKKLEGSEGFLIPFALDNDDNFYWWNIGGWNNTQTGVEKSTNGAKYIVGQGKSLGVETDRWYQLKIEVRGNLAKFYLDGELIQTINDQPAQAVHSVSSYQKDNNSVVVKVVNYSEDNKNINFVFKGDKNLLGPLSAKRISAPNLDEVNSLDNPDNVDIEDLDLSKIEIQEQKVNYKLKPYSLTIIEFELEK
ncbi:MAG: alpha-L-arabinofuranosidase C-terminal domain-containing protein [bacterium]